ncbi:hypothetical protein BJV78DRAFT_822216 [Lactifluus subvellereus]|nr:hypothetical protein BJV78DRAFT_822216 [Lactifluus subvellereus]
MYPSRISAEQGYPVEAQNILLSGRSLQDDRSIESYNMKSTSPLVLLPRAGSMTGSTITNGTSATHSPRTAPALPVSTPPPPPPAPAPVPPPVSLSAPAQPITSGLPPVQGAPP